MPRKGQDDIMRSVIIFTITQGEDQNQEALLELSTEYIEYVKLVSEKEKWKVSRLGVGIHKNASRLHTHIAIIVDIPDEQNVKFWNKKLQSLFKLENPNYECRRTLWKSDNPKYNEECAITYLFKEYESDDEIVLKEKFIGIDAEEMSRLRDIGNTEYKKSVAEHERTALRKKQEEDENENIVQFIKDFTSPKNRKTNTEYGQFEFVQFKQKYLIVKIAILEYYQQRYEQTGKRSFKAYSIRDKAISYLTTENLCSKVDLAEFLN